MMIMMLLLLFSSSWRKLINDIVRWVTARATTSVVLAFNEMNSRQEVQVSSTD
jgi:hypothetical protein